VWFDPVHRSSIYLNLARSVDAPGDGNDLAADTLSHYQVVVDTFTVLQPSDFHVSPLNSFTLDIRNAKIQQARADLYVNPETGDDGNSGLTENEPLKTIMMGLHKAIASADEPRTIYLANGRYTRSAESRFPIPTRSHISFVGESQTGVVLDGEWLFPILALYKRQQVGLANMTLTGSSGDQAVLCYESSLALKNVTVSDNLRRGVMVRNNSSAEVDSCLIANNHSDAAMEIWLGSYATITNTVIEGNSGQGLYLNESSHAIIENLTIRDNNGIGLQCKEATLTATQLSVLRNREHNYFCDGTVSLVRSAVSLNDCTIEANDIVGRGGGIYVGHSSVDVSRVSISRNSADYRGGGMFVDEGSTVRLSEVTISQNRTDGRGGGLYIYSGANVRFDSLRRCNIYLNEGPTGSDLCAEYFAGVVHVAVDTFTVLHPTCAHVFPLSAFTFDILHGLTIPEPVNRQLSLSSNTSFGRVHVLNRSTSGFVRVTNVGAEPVRVYSTQLTGSSTFVQRSYPSLPLVLQPSQSLTWTFQFVPDAEGERTAQFRILSDAGGCTHEVWLSALAVNTPLGPWGWQYVGAPLGTREVNSVFIDPENDSVWYVASMAGLYVTRDAGRSWQAPHLAGFVHSEAFSIDRSNPSQVFFAHLNGVYGSADKGVTWRLLHTLPSGGTSASVLASSYDGRIFVTYGMNPESNARDPGVYITSDSGRTWSFSSFGFAMENVICWDIEEDAITGTLYVSTEIGHHPQPYRPPFFRSTDRGLTWENVSQGLPWHVVKIQVDSSSHVVYALTEGAGLYRSTDAGRNWEYLSNFFGLELSHDGVNRGRVYGGAHTYGSGDGGAFCSSDGGTTFERIGLTDLIVNSLALNSTCTRLHAASYGAGLFTTPVPLQTHVEAKEDLLVSDFGLHQNYPNPFNPATVIKYTVGGTRLQESGGSDVKLAVYDLLGREVAVLVSEKKAPGTYEVRFDAKGLASGVYLYRLQAGDVVQSKKLVLLR
jgi:photosystem II stability/assembly factor-like uncharacterized protein